MTTFDAAEAIKALERIASALESEKENVSGFSPADVEDLLNQFEAMLERRTEDFIERLSRSLECILTKAQEEKEEVPGAAGMRVFNMGKLLPLMKEAKSELP